MKPFTPYTNALTRCFKSRDLCSTAERIYRTENRIYTMLKIVSRNFQSRKKEKEKMTFEIFCFEKFFLKICLNHIFAKEPRTKSLTVKINNEKVTGFYKKT